MLKWHIWRVIDSWSLTAPTRNSVRLRTEFCKKNNDLGQAYFSPQLSTAIKLKKAAIIFVMKLPSTRSPKLRLLCRLPGWIPWGHFRGNRSCWSSIFTFFHILFTSHTLQLSRANLCSWKNQKRKKVLGEKKETKEKKTGPKKKERVPKISLWKRLV